MLQIIRYRNWYFGFSLLLVILSLFAIFGYGIKEGIDFAGGSIMSVRMEDEVQAETVRIFLEKDLKREDITVVQDLTNKVYTLRTAELSEADHKKILTDLSAKFGKVEEVRYESFGPAVGEELRTNSFIAFFLVLFVISLYVSFAFRKATGKVSVFTYAFVTILTLFHDVIIPLGLLAYLGHTRGVEVGVTIVVAILAIIGFSVHDTIVVIDRTRENLHRMSGKSFSEIVNTSLNETLARSINTSLTLIFTLLALVFFGPASLFYFSLTILVGVFFGTYSSIFLASSLLTIMEKRRL
ncbi:MAG: protein translocase subunit SecF [Candidatus Harrisonbacteria bacterium]|nr:protein translocase subunit SecF [Candidatus Harrisonbacteria bacterium]